eukprot:TRINITY_DN8016_c0_g1_i2.p1 TRINITY_DN8016_c0_g1~~TRINITY_DN8016_c0_g1_i2.p1  ORF type:complete len:470 (-),score=113.46 TRINITY_DN8016_c0_g1_i2:139-1470(-)
MMATGSCHVSIFGTCLLLLWPEVSALSVQTPQASQLGVQHRLCSFWCLKQQKKDKNFRCTDTVMEKCYNLMGRHTGSMMQSAETESASVLQTKKASVTPKEPAKKRLATAFPKRPVKTLATAAPKKPVKQRGTQLLQQKAETIEVKQVDAPESHEIPVVLQQQAQLQQVQQKVRVTYDKDAGQTEGLQEAVAEVHALATRVDKLEMQLEEVKKSSAERDDDKQKVDAEKKETTEIRDERHDEDTEAKACSDAPSSAKDAQGYSCTQGYADTPSFCGDYDDDDFTAHVQCCACHGAQADLQTKTESQTAAAQSATLTEPHIRRPPSPPPVVPAAVPSIPKSTSPVTFHSTKLRGPPPFSPVSMNKTPPPIMPVIHGRTMMIEREQAVPLQPTQGEASEPALQSSKVKQYGAEGHSDIRSLYNSLSQEQREELTEMYLESADKGR